MDLIKLKENILNKNIKDDFIIFKYTDNKFLTEQYIQYILNIKNGPLIYIENLSDINQNNYLLNDNTTFVYNIDKLNEVIIKPNLIVVCKDINKNILDNVKKYLIEMPKLENWQIKDYVKTKLDNVDDNQIEWFCKINNYNIYLIDNELKKLTLFEPKISKYLFNELYINNNDYNYYNCIFDVSNAIIKRDALGIERILNNVYNANNAQIDVLYLINILEKNFINILNLQTTPNISPDKLNLNYSQFLAIKNNCNKYTNEQLFKILKLLFNLDYQLKSGKLPYNKLIEYLVVNIIGV